MLDGETELPDWCPCHHQHHHGVCFSGVNKDSRTITEGCKKGSSEPDEMQQGLSKFYIEQSKETVSNIENPEYFKELSSTIIASVMEGLGSSFL